MADLRMNTKTIIEMSVANKTDMLRLYRRLDLLWSHKLFFNSRCLKMANIGLTLFIGVQAMFGKGLNKSIYLVD